MILDILLGLIDKIWEPRHRNTESQSQSDTSHKACCIITYHTSVLHPRAPSTNAKPEYSAFLRSIQRSAACFSFRASSNPVPPCFFAIAFTMSADSWIARGVGPWNLKKRLSFSGYLRADWPYRFVARIKSSSQSSTHSAAIAPGVRVNHTHKSDLTHESRHHCS